MQPRVDDPSIIGRGRILDGKVSVIYLDCDAACCGYKTAVPLAKPILLLKKAKPR